jgi:hypothetical protein
MKISVLFLAAGTMILAACSGGEAGSGSEASNPENAQAGTSEEADSVYTGTCYAHSTLLSAADNKCHWYVSPYTSACHVTWRHSCDASHAWGLYFDCCY